MKREGEVIFTLGNDAMTAGAIAAGARFYDRDRKSVV